MTEDSNLSRRSKGKIGFLIGLVALLVFGLSAAWYWAAGQLDDTVTGFARTLESDGKVLRCSEQDVAGYPFRIGLFCTNVIYTDPVSGISVAGGPLRSAAQLYRPGHVVAELDAPYDVTLPGLAPLTLDWTAFRSSSRVTTGGPQRLSVVVDELGVSANDFGQRDLLAKMKELQLHTRPGGDDPRSLDIALSAQSWLVDDNGAGLIESVDLSFSANVEEAFAALQSGRDLLDLLRSNGGRAMLDDFTLATQDGGRVNISGPLEVGRNGRVSGQLTINMDDPARLVAYVSTVFPPIRQSLDNTAQYLQAFATQDGGRAKIRDFKLTIREGKVIAGFFEIGEIPRLF